LTVIARRYDVAISWSYKQDEILFIYLPYIMKKLLSISLLTSTALVIAGCSSSTSTTPSAVVDVDPLTAAHATFLQQFAKCEKNIEDCAAVGRDTVIEGTITKVHDGIDLVDISTNQGTPTTIPILTNTYDGRSTVLVNQSWKSIGIEDVSVGDAIKADVRAFDRIENGELTEKLGQYGYIIITQQ